MKKQTKVPFGLHKESNLFFDASSVPSGAECNCICHQCEGDLLAIHATKRQKHFRHKPEQLCAGALESLFHKVGKQILKENNRVVLPQDKAFYYSACDVEFERHGKRPDAFLSHEEKSLIVEIYFSHITAKSTLDIYKENDEQVLEIDISSQRMKLFDYDVLKDLILNSAPRKFIGERSTTFQNKSQGNNTWIWLLLVFLSLVGLLWYRHHQRRRR